MRNREVIEFREIKEIKEIKEFKEYREEVIYSANTLAIFPKFPILLIFPIHQPPNFVSEWCRCGDDMKKPRMGSTCRTSHSGL